MMRTRGLRSTSARVHVLQTLERADAPLSHAEVAESLADLGYDRVTIYRNLLDLTEVGLLTKTDLGDHVWRFELRREGKEHSTLHPHFVCTDCGTVACLPENAVSLTIGTNAPRVLRSNSIQVQLKGVCDHCG